MAKLKNYSVTLLFKFTIENQARTFYEESIRLFHAESFDDAIKKAELSVHNANHFYTNIYGSKVTYSFYEAVSAFLIYDKIKFNDGTEVFSNIFEMENPDDDPVEKRCNSSSIEDKYILRDIELNGGAL